MSINMFYHEYHSNIFSFPFLYLSSIVYVIALSILYVKHPNKHNNRRCSINAIFFKKESNPCQTWSDLRNIYEFDKAITFKGAPSSLRQFLAIKSSLKMMENVFYFISKALLYMKIYPLLY